MNDGFDEYLNDRKIKMTDVLTSYLLWFTAVKSNFTGKEEKIKLAEEILLYDLINTWGDGSRIETDINSLEIRCYGPSKQFTVFKEPDLKDL